MKLTFAQVVTMQGRAIFLGVVDWLLTERGFVMTGELQIMKGASIGGPMYCCRRSMAVRAAERVSLRSRQPRHRLWEDLGHRGRRRLPAKNVAPAVRVGSRPFIRDDLFQRWAAHMPFQPAGLFVEATNRVEALPVAEFGVAHGRF